MIDTASARISIGMEKICQILKILLELLFLNLAFNSFTFLRLP
ncbi:hypothetical protein [Pontibacter qinzhouensis]|nr:hypothetical protein [Pontibacter qinzhouensis]